MSEPQNTQNNPAAQPVDVNLLLGGLALKYGNDKQLSMSRAELTNVSTTDVRIIDDADSITIMMRTEAEWLKMQADQLKHQAQLLLDQVQALEAAAQQGPLEAAVAAIQEPPTPNGAGELTPETIQKVQEFLAAQQQAS